MRIGFHTGYWSAGPPPGAAEAVTLADDLGFDSVWTAEAYGSDALTPLAWWGARTSRVLLGTGIAQLDARSPAATAMAALTLDHLSGGRFVLGLGVSGPQVVEGWYGRPYARPLARTREYVEIVRSVLAREAPLRAPGPHYPLPLSADGGGSGRGKALTSTVHPLRADLPIHLAAQGPKNIALAAEIADGWLPAFFAPSQDGEARARLAEGFARRAPERSPASEFEVSAVVPVALGEDVEQAAVKLKGYVALYIGGMGSSEANFHREAIARLGWAEACEEIASVYPRDKAAAAAAVPTELVLDIALAGSPGELREQLRRWEATCVTRLIAQSDPRALPILAEALL